MDDIFLCAQSYELLEQHRDTVLKLLVSLGFYPNLRKSQLTPSVSMLRLRYLWNSKSMSISIPEEKCGKTRTLASRYQFYVTLRQLASFI